MSDATARLNAALEGRYRIERQLGEGGMATVYLARDEKHNRNVALKVLKPELAAVVGAERFLAEIETTANLQHPHILPLFDSGEADTYLFYVMPYVEGETLRDRLDREHQLPVDEAVRIATNLAEALDYAHKQGVIHRDIKPANILLQSGKPIISDFGIALAVGAAGGGRLTETGLSLGTPHYMSPEQATGDLSVGAPTDVYALGCVLFEMLVGEPPYTGSTAQAILGKIIAGELASAMKHRKSVPANVDAAIRKALEKVPADRFTGAQDFATGLGEPEFRYGEAATAGAAAVVGPWKRMSMALGAGVLALALALGWSVFRPPTPLPISRLELGIPMGLERSGFETADLALSPDGSFVVFRARSTDDSEAYLWMRALDQLEPIPIPGTEGGRNPRFSPDGTSLAFVSGTALMTVSLAGGPPQVVVRDSVQVEIGGIAWGPDDTLYFRKTGMGIWGVSREGGQAYEVITAISGADIAWPDALPDGKGILFTRLSRGAIRTPEIATASPESGEVRVLFEGAMARYAPTGHVIYTSVDGTLLAAPFDVDRLEVVGSSRVTISEGVMVRSGTGASEFALSATGMLAYRAVSEAAGDEGTPVWVDRRGSEEPLSPILVGRFQAPAVSPNGRKIAVEYRPDELGSQVWIYDLDQETFTRLTPERGMRRPFWSPNGREVGYVSVSDGALYSRAWDSSDEPRILRNASPGPNQEAQWTPDGLRLLYRQGNITDDMPTAIYHAPPHPDSTSVVILQTAGSTESVYAPSLSPNGRWLAYTSNETGRDEVYVRPFPGSGGRRQLSVEGGRRPVWAHNGREIFYRLLGSGALMVAAVQADSVFGVETRDEVGFGEEFIRSTTTQQFDLSPDDQFVLGIRAADAPNADRVWVVQNFFEELTRLAPAN